MDKKMWHGTTRAMFRLFYPCSQYGQYIAQETTEGGSLKTLSIRLTLGLVALTGLLVSAKNVAAQDVPQGAEAPSVRPVRAIPYRYITIEELAGRKVGSGEKFPVTTPQGTVLLPKAEAERYINEREKQANAAGDSLTYRPDASSTQDEVRARAVDAINSPEEVLERSAREVSENPPVKSWGNASPSGGLTTRGGKAQKIYTFTYVKGNKSEAAVDVNGGVTLRAGKTMAELNGSLNVDGYLKNRKYSLMTFEYLADAPEKGNGRTIGRITVSGYQVWSRDKKGNFAEATLTDQFWNLWSPKSTQVEIRTSAWGIPIVCRAGVEGTVGVKLKASLRAMGAGFAVVPYVQARAFAEAAVDLILVQFGIGGELNIVKYQAPIWAYAEARMSRGRMALKATVDVSNSLTAGDGRIYAKIDVLGLYDKKKTLVEWGPAFAWSGTLFKEEYWAFVP